jgi:hypothetical protein
MELGKNTVSKSKRHKTENNSGFVPFVFKVCFYQATGTQCLIFQSVLLSSNRHAVPAIQ